MNPLAVIARQIRTWFSRQTSTMSSVFGFGTTEVYSEIDASTAITKGFNANAAVYAIINKDAKKFGSIPRYVHTTDQKEEKANSLLQDLINRPNPYEGQDAFYAKTRAYYKVCGEAFIWLNRGSFADGVEDDNARKKMPVLEMYCLPPNKIIVVPDETLFGITGYILEANTRIAIHRADIIHWKATNLEFDAASKPQLRGMPALKPGYKTLEQNNSATDSAVRMYQNDGAKGVLAEESLKAMSPTQEAQIKGVVDRKINNNDMKGAVATLQGKWNYFDIGKDSVDMELLEGKQMSMKELCFLLGMPYELFDSQTTWANKEIAQVGWISNEILPDCKQLDGEMNRVLPTSFATTEFIATDASELPEIQKAMAESAKAMMDNWTITPDEVREFLGYDALGGEFGEPWVPSGRTPMSAMQEDRQAMNDEFNRAANTTSDKD